MGRRGGRKKELEEEGVREGYGKEKEMGMI